MAAAPWECSSTFETRSSMFGSSTLQGIRSKNSLAKYPMPCDKSNRFLRMNTLSSSRFLPLPCHLKVFPHILRIPSGTGMSLTHRARSTEKLLTVIASYLDCRMACSVGDMLTLPALARCSSHKRSLNTSSVGKVTMSSGTCPYRMRNAGVRKDPCGNKKE